MSDPEPDFPTPTPSAPPTGRGRSSVVDEHLRRWGEDLVELTRRNRLLYFRHLRSGSLEFDQPAAAILDGLSARANGGGWGFYLPPPPPAEGAEPLPEIGLEPAPDELIVAASLERDGVQIARGLKNLAARAQAEFLDAGIWVLYLGLGCAWCRAPATRRGGSWRPTTANRHSTRASR